MDAWPFSYDRLRGMYRGGRADPAARRFARLWALIFGLGLAPRRWVTLEVVGRRSGRTVRFPLGMADSGGHWYLVPMLGGECNWVQNVRAAGGRATLRHRRAMACRLVEVPADERAPIIKRYLQKVPGARPHVPVGRGAPIAEFEAIAQRHPVFQVCPGRPDHAAGPARSSRKRHWWRWIAGGAAALVALIVLAAALVVKLQPVPAPLALPARAAAPAGPLNGTWDVTAGSVAGFRVPESVLGMSNDAVGRTGDITGAVVISGGRVTAATFRIALTGIKVDGKTQRQFAESLDTARHPVATFTLAGPAALGPAFAAGGVVTVTARGNLTMRGISQPVSLKVTARRDGSVLQAAGSIPVTFSAWRITTPAGYSFLGSLADHGVAEFLVLLRRGGQG
jgi:polyisoprenoid-binding protein YceI